MLGVAAGGAMRPRSAGSCRPVFSVAGPARRAQLGDFAQPSAGSVVPGDMQRSRGRGLLWLAAMAVAVAVVAVVRHDHGGGVVDARPERAARADGAATGARAAAAPALELRSDEPASATFAVEGIVLDDADVPVPDAEVVFAGDAGEGTAITDDDGRYRLELSPGDYHAYVVGESVLSMGPSSTMDDYWRATASDVGRIDETLGRAVAVFRDETDVDLEVDRAGVVEGHVRDPNGRPIAGAIVRVTNEERTIIGANLAETAADGSFRLVTTVGHTDLLVTHPTYAGIDPERNDHGDGVDVAAGEVATVELTLTFGCYIEGRVVTATGAPAPAGDLMVAEVAQSADEEDGMDVETEARIEADGTFRWEDATGARAIEMYAAPAGMPRSNTERFTCHPGERTVGVVLTLRDDAPDLQGIVVGSGGRPIAGAHVEVVGSPSRSDVLVLPTDAAGRWSAYDVEPDDYWIRAYDDAGRMAGQRITASAEADVTLVLREPAVLAGRFAGVEAGWLVIAWDDCAEEPATFETAASERRVPIVAGRYRAPGIPACVTRVSFTWGDGEWHEERDVQLVPGQVFNVDFD